MRKIDKNCALSTDYKKWEEQLEQEQQLHPKYNSSKGKYYWDVVMQLHKCQKGLCAYTEEELCDEGLFAENFWVEGKYQIIPAIPSGRFGELDHFDETLKSKRGERVGRKDWLWDNFFMVKAEINKRKGTKPVDYILKPDEHDYDPFELLDYDVEEHQYIPSDTLDEETFERVKTMIKTLGLNQVYSKRRKYLRKLFRNYRLQGQQTSEQAEEYPTAYEFCQRKLAIGEIEMERLVPNL